MVLLVSLDRTHNETATNATITIQVNTMVAFSLNGKPQSVAVDADTPLLWVIREHLKLTGTKFGCGAGLCGSCTVHIDGESVKSCTVFAVQADGCEVTTIEGIGGPYNGFSAVQEGFRQEHGVQCGYCTPGFVMSAAKLIEERPQPSRSEAEEALIGNFCRCTGYRKILDAVVAAGKAAQSEHDPN